METCEFKKELNIIKETKPKNETYFGQEWYCNEYWKDEHATQTI